MSSPTYFHRHNLKHCFQSFLETNPLTTAYYLYDCVDFLNKYYRFLTYLRRGPMLSGIYAHATQSQQLRKIMVLWTPTTRIIFPWESLKYQKLSFWTFLSGFGRILYLDFKKCLHCEISQMHTIRILPSLSFSQKWVEDLFKGGQILKLFLFIFQLSGNDPKSCPQGRYGQFSGDFLKMGIKFEIPFLKLYRI